MEKIEQKNLELPSPRQPREKPWSIVLLFLLPGKNPKVSSILLCMELWSSCSSSLSALDLSAFAKENTLQSCSQPVLTRGLEWLNTHHTCTYTIQQESLANNRVFAKLKPSKLFHSSVHFIIIIISHTILLPLWVSYFNNNSIEVCRHCGSATLITMCSPQHELHCYNHIRYRHHKHTLLQKHRHD